MKELSNPTSPAPDSSTGSREPSRKVSVFGISFDPSLAALAMVGLATAYLLLFVAPLELMHHPWVRLLLVFLATIITTAVLVFIDHWENSGGAMANTRERQNAVEWLILVLLLWPLAFPGYYWERSRLRSPNRTRLALILTGAYLLVLLILCTVFFFSSTETGPARRGGQPEITINGMKITPESGKAMIIMPEEVPGQTSGR